jgi:hypothetical protein
VFEFFSCHKETIQMRARQNDQHQIHGHSSPRVDEDGSALLGKAKNPL